MGQRAAVLVLYILGEAVRLDAYFYFGPYCQANEYCTRDLGCNGFPAACAACPANSYSGGEDGSYSQTCECGPGRAPAVSVLESPAEPQLRLVTSGRLSSHDQFDAANNEAICGRVEVSFEVTSSRGETTFPQGEWGTVLDEANTLLSGSAPALICSQMGLSGGRFFPHSTFNTDHPSPGPFWMQFMSDYPTHKATGCLSNATSFLDQSSCSHFFSNTRIHRCCS